mmetsp:Transcript_1891/g.6746  ORF Transcript_1891/g.6746 Transcript_1891/m.6746 type:complete len:208 (-) Transcript_1891:38-661(-)
MAGGCNHANREYGFYEHVQCELDAQVTTTTTTTTWTTVTESSIFGGSSSSTDICTKTTTEGSKLCLKYNGQELISRCRECNEDLDIQFSYAEPALDPKDCKCARETRETVGYCYITLVDAAVAQHERGSAATAAELKESQALVLANSSVLQGSGRRYVRVRVVLDYCPLCGSHIVIQADKALAALESAPFVAALGYGPKLRQLLLQQ